LQQAPHGSEIIRRPAQIPDIAQRRLVLGTPGVPRERGRVGERQALGPQATDRVIVAGDRMQRGECGAPARKPASSGVFGMLRTRAQAGNGGTQGGGAKVIRARAMGKCGRVRRFWRLKSPQNAAGVGG
jgi:hypothetical protein